MKTGHLRPSNAAKRFAIEGGLLLFNTNFNRLYAFNDSARVIWDVIEGGCYIDDLANDISLAWDIPAEQAYTDLNAIIAQWFSLGLLFAGSADHPVAVVPPAASDFATEADEGEATHDWTCSISGRLISFSVGYDLSPVIAAMFDHLKVPTSAAPTHFGVRRTSTGDIVLTRDGAETLRTDDVAQTVGALWQAVLEVINPDVQWLALIHGGAVGYRGQAVGLCGPSGSGKSTLVAALVRSGLTYLADDMITVSSPDGTVVPLPLPQSIKPGSIDILRSRYPTLADAARLHTKGLDTRLLVQPDARWDGMPMPLTTIVFPRYREGAAPVSRRLSPFDALGRLLNERIWLGHPLTPDHIATLLRWIEKTRCFAIAYGTLDDSVKCVRDILP